MKARARFGLDLALLGALIAAYRPDWTGATLHQWIGIAIIAPLFVHGVVNWEWTARAVRKLFARLRDASRIDLTVDGVLFFAAVFSMVSGFMVSPDLLAPIGVHVSATLAWHDIHSWSADATITMLALHAVMHWRWLFKVAATVFGISASHRAEGPALSDVAPTAASTATATAGATAAMRADAPPAFDDIAGEVGVDVALDRSARRRASHVGRRASQVARERAIALRTISVLGITAVAGVLVFAGVGAASPPEPAPRPSGVQVAEANTTPAESGGTKSANPSAAGSTAKPKPKSKPKPKPKPKAKPKSTGASKSATKPKPKAKATSPASKKTVTRATASQVMTCPKTGCSASSCHATHHKSAAAYYKTH